MKNLTFKNNDSMPIIGLGTWRAEPGEVYKAVREAIKIGYRHIDCAPLYGNEAEIGEAFKDAFESGDVKREDLWVTSKLWCNDHHKENVVSALKKTLKDLQLDYLDLFLIHWPIALKEKSMFPESPEDYISLDDLPIEITWEGMEDCLEQNLTKHIGVSNFSIKKIKDLLEKCKIKPEMNQVEMHPYLQQKSLVDYCHKNDIHLTAYSPLGSKGNNSEEINLFNNELINNIAKKVGCYVAQVLLSWQMHRNISVIPKSVNPERLAQNFSSQNVDLSESDLQEIAKIDKNHRFIDGEKWAMPGSSYTLENIWDEQ